MFNFYIDNNTFPNWLKEVGIKPVYKKDDPFDKTNHKAISILSVLSKAFEHCLYDQIYEYVDTIKSSMWLPKRFQYAIFINGCDWKMERKNG